MGREKESGYARVTREQIHQAFRLGFDAVASIIEYQQDLIDNLSQRIKTLEAQGRQNSQNSSKPPSSDGIGRRPYPPRQKSGKKPGGQPGHEGSTLQMVAHPDHVVVHPVTHCGKCGCSLKKKLRTVIRRQVFDLPVIQVEVEEHQLEVKDCPHCGATTVGECPAHVSQPVQYGSRIQAMEVYLRNFALVPFARTAQIFKDLFGVSLSAGTLAKTEQKASGALVDVVEEIKQRILAEKVRHLDETGFSFNGKLAWMHGASTGEYSYFYPHRARGKEGIREMGILGQGVASVAVHDNWAAYAAGDCLHALCNAHQGRELKFVKDENLQPWAGKMLDLLLEGKKEVQQAREAGRKRLSPQRLQWYRSRYEKIIREGLRANPPPVRGEESGRRGRIKKSKAANLLERLSKRRDETLRYLKDFSVPYDNNQIERDLRMLKVQQKISGTFRSWDGAVAFCRIRSFISTMQKQGASVFDGLCRIFDARPLTLSRCLRSA